MQKKELDFLAKLETLIKEQGYELRSSTNETAINLLTVYQEPETIFTVKFSSLRLFERDFALFYDKHEPQPSCME